MKDIEFIKITKKEFEIKLRKLKLTQANILEEYLEGKIEKNELQSHKAKTAALIKKQVKVQIKI